MYYGHNKRETVIKKNPEKVPLLNEYYIWILYFLENVLKRMTGPKVYTTSHKKSVLLSNGLINQRSIDLSLTSVYNFKKCLVRFNNENEIIRTIAITRAQNFYLYYSILPPIIISGGFHYYFIFV